MVAAREDLEQLPAITSEYGRQREADKKPRLHTLRPTAMRRAVPRRMRRHTDGPCPSGRNPPEMGMWLSVRISTMGRSASTPTSHRRWCASSRRKGCNPCQHQPPRKRADDYRSGNSLVKLSTNIGNSALSSGIEEEVSKAVWSCYWGGDTLMWTLSTGDNITNTRMDYTQLPSTDGYCASIPGSGESHRRCSETPWEIYPRRTHRAGRTGCRLLYHPCRVLRRYADLISERHTGIVSRGGSIMTQWAVMHGEENFLYTHFDEICGRCLPATMWLYRLATVCAPAQSTMPTTHLSSSAHELGELTEKAWAHGIQVLIEGPGHVHLCIRYAKTWTDGYRRATKPHSIPSDRLPPTHSPRLRPYHIGHQGRTDSVDGHSHDLLRHPKEHLLSPISRMCATV